MKDTTGKGMRLTHEECQGLFDDYTKGRLNDWEQALVQEHLVNCGECSNALVKFIEKEIDAGNVPILKAPDYPPKELFERTV